MAMTGGMSPTMAASLPEVVADQGGALSPARSASAASPADLRGQVALVTGGGRGLGRAIALALAQAGADVAVTARSAGELHETAALVVAAGGQALALPACVAEPAAVEQVVCQAETRLGPLGLLVNNAGMAGPVGLTWAADPAAWWRALAVNLYGPLLFIRAAVPGMVARGRGRVVNMASAAGLGTGRHFSAYATSKAALIRLTEALAAEAAGTGVCAFAIHPGLVQTAMVHSVLQSPEQARLLPGIPDAVREGRDVPPERVAALVVQLASGVADDLSGRYLSVTDDLPALLARAAEIQRERLHTMRLVT
jgi:NAD(P)-dependent dehydrogenase (short-subunit alcohol dehydrogenase family)